MRVLVTILAISLALILPGQVTADETIFHFDYDLEGMSTSNSVWHWSNRGDIGNRIPSGGGGFAVLSVAGDGDQLFSADIPVQYGLDYSLTYFLSSELDAGTTLQLQRIATDGTVIEVIVDLTSQSKPSNTKWLTHSGYVAPGGSDSRFAVFCQTSSSNPAGTDGYLWGCAIDAITLTNGDIPETTTASGSTLLPGGSIDFDFENGTDGWVLGRSNGATWRRTRNMFENVAPTNGEYMLQVYPADMHSGVVMAMSPRLKVGETGSIALGVDFYMQGSAEYPAYLKLRRTTSYTKFDEFPALNLDSFGDQENQNWLQHGIVYRDLTPGEEFNIVMEASLGINQNMNKIAVSRVQISGAELVDLPEEAFFEFTDGLVGWNMGSVDGGRWLVYNHSEIDANFYIPPPALGDNILVIDRFDIHGGVVSIESPPITWVPGTVKTINIGFWMRGSVIYPSSLRVRRKSISGIYDAMPFLDLTPFGNVNNLKWLQLESNYEIPNEGTETDYFQLVFEADLGGDMTNLVAIDAIRIHTRVPV